MAELQQRRRSSRQPQLLVFVPLANEGGVVAPAGLESSTSQISRSGAVHVLLAAAVRSFFDGCARDSMNPMVGGSADLEGGNELRPGESLSPAMAGAGGGGVRGRRYLLEDVAVLWKRFKGDETPPAHIGASRDYNVDMVPKFMMANGALVRVLIHTGVTKYLSFKAVDGSYVFNKGKIHKVPSTDMEALKSPLMGLFEKRRAGKFFLYVQDYRENDPSTHKGLDLTKMTSKQLISKYGLDDNTIDFIGHAVALHKDDSYLSEPAIEIVKRMKLYAESVARFQGGSPYIYPLYGLGELPQGFARLSAVYGGTYMLNKPECKVEFDDEGKVCGVTSEGETAKCKKVVCDPSYLPEKEKKVGKVFRAIAIMSHPIPNTAESHSVQIIIPQKQLGRRSDMYVFCCSYSHNVASKGKFIAFVSAQAESDNPEAELKPGIDLLGPVDELFFDTYDRYEPANDPSSDNCFISTSYDATTHFESTVMDVLSLYTKITEKTVDLSVDLSAASATEDDF